MMSNVDTCSRNNIFMVYVYIPYFKSHLRISLHKFNLV